MTQETTADEELIALRARVAELEGAEAALEKLKADRSAETIRTAGRLARLAWILMIIMVVFAGTIIVAGAIRTSARECPAVLQPTPVERP